MDETLALRAVVQDLASKIRDLKKIVLATQTFCTTLADQVDLMEEKLGGDIGALEDRLLAKARATEVRFTDIARAAADHGH